MPGSFPAALAEKSFVVPGGESMPTHEGRRNLTDQQETAQWLGGRQVPAAILQALLGALYQHIFLSFVSQSIFQFV